MLTELCQELRNWFVRKKHIGSFSIENGNITADFLADGQYFRVIGSIFNDGVHKYPANNLIDETFEGAVWALAIPPEVVALSAEIDTWNNKYAGADSAAMSPFQSESWGGYSYAKGSANGNNSVGGSDWATVFGSRLNKWRKI